MCWCSTTRSSLARVDEETVRSIHAALRDKIGQRFFIIAPRGVFDFQQDYIDLEGVRYYALRIPYSVINELHHRDFTALRQPNDETAVNDTVDAVGFDFIQPPEVTWTVGVGQRQGQILNEAYLKIEGFESRARIRGQDRHGGLETFSMLMLDFDYDGEVFSLDAAHYAAQLQADEWRAWLTRGWPRRAGDGGVYGHLWQRGARGHYAGEVRGRSDKSFETCQV